MARALLLGPLLAALLAGSGPLRPVAVPSAVHHTAIAARPVSPAAGPARLAAGARAGLRPPLPLIAPVTQAPPPAVDRIESAVQQVRHRPAAPRVESARVPRPRGTGRPSRSTRPALHVITVGLPTGDVGRVIAYALAQAGKPYIFGAAGPRGFDCSGLVLAAYRTIGILLPHLAASQAHAGRRVPLSQVAPGDILIFYGGGHAAIALGGGMMIAASRQGRPVAVQRVSDTPDEARRLVG